MTAQDGGSVDKGNYTTVPRPLELQVVINHEILVDGISNLGESLDMLVTQIEIARRRGHAGQQWSKEG